MSQDIWGTIDPNSTSGTQLAELLNDFKDAVVSGFSGDSTRPSNLQENGYWVKYNTPDNGFVSYMFYDGTQDIEMFKINKTSASLVLADGDTEFTIVRNSDDALGPILKLKKIRTTGNQTLAGDSIGDMEFIGNDASAVEYVQAKITTVSKDDVTSIERGADVEFHVTQDNGATLIKAMVLFNSQRLGLGVTAADKKIHTLASDTSAGAKHEIAVDSSLAAELVLRKKRLANGGQVVLNDETGVFKATSTDTNGDERESFAIKGVATEAHLPAASGTKVVIQRVKSAEATLSDAIIIEDDLITFEENIIADNVGGSIQTPTRLDVKQDTEANLTTYAATASNGQLCFATDTKLMYQVIDGALEPVGGGAGGGGSSLIWKMNGDTTPIESVVDGFDLLDFDYTSTQDIYATIVVPSTYEAGEQISIKGGKVLGNAATGNILFKCETALIEPGSTVLGTYTNVHTSTNSELTLSVANRIENVGNIDLTAVGGLINAVAVAAGDLLRIKLTRDYSNETSSATVDARLIRDSFEPSFVE